MADPPVTAVDQWRPRVLLFAPVDRRQAPPQREQRRARQVGGACGLAGRLDDVQKVFTGAKCLLLMISLWGLLKPDRLITRSTAPCPVRASCTNYSGRRTDGTRWAGII